MLEHREIKGTVEFDQETKMFFGKLLEINGLVMYEAESAKDFEKNFISAVDEYIQMCEENEMPIKKEYKGVFNVRTSPEMHKGLADIAIERGVKLNAIINEAFNLYLSNTKSALPIIEYCTATPIGSWHHAYTKNVASEFNFSVLKAIEGKSKKIKENAVKTAGSKLALPKHISKHHDESK